MKHESIPSPEHSLPTSTPSSIHVTRENRMKLKTRVGSLAGCLIFAAATYAAAQGNPPSLGQHTGADNNPLSVAQVVALDECDPTTFNAALGPDFCKNIAVGYFTTLSDLFAKAQAGTPDPNWDFEPDTLKVRAGTTVSVVDQGGEPHTFTEVAHFGGGFIPGLNGPGEGTVPECTGGFSRVAVAKTRILQGSQLQITGLSKGKHHFQCCIHPWMRTDVEVK
jgi:plastocyanin